MPDVRDRSLDTHLSPRMRKYLPTLADLLDRLTIAQLKAIFLPEHRREYLEEVALIEYDVDVVLGEKFAEGGYRLTGAAVRAIMMLMLTNRFIWENESRARAGGDDQDRLLKLTHSINGVRNTAKNELSHIFGERKDHKVDCFAAQLAEEFGNWNVFGK